MATRRYAGSTEPQARKVLEGIESRRKKKKAPKKKKLSPTKPTARTPKGVQKSKAQGAKEREALRRKQRERVAAAKKKRK